MKTTIKQQIFYWLIFLVILGVFYYQGAHILKTLQQTKLTVTPWLVVLSIPYIALGGRAFDELCRPYQIHLRFKDWFGLSFIASFVNQLLPYRPGMAVRYFYLRQHYGMTLPQFSVVMIIYLLLTLLFGAAFTATGWFIPDLPVDYYFTLKVAFYVGGGITFLFILAAILKKWFIRFYHQPASIILSGLWLCIMQGIAASLIYLSFLALAAPLPLLHCLFLSGILSITMILPLTPGNIGVLETLMGSFTLMMYNNFSLGFSAIALLRVCQFIPSLLLGGFFSSQLLGRYIPRISSSISLGDAPSVD